MVKELVKGLLKKKSKDEPKEDIPDELPPLAEDIIKEEEKKVDEKIEQEVSKDSPDELPTLDDSNSKEQDANGAPDELPSLTDTEPTETPDELPSLDDESLDEEIKKIAEDPSTLKNESIQKPQDLTNSISEKTKKPESLQDDFGFFSNLAKITKNQGINKKLLTKDLFEGMKSYYSIKSSVTTISTNSQALEMEVTKKLEVLKQLEKKWNVQNKLLEKNKEIQLENEKEIQTKTAELAPLIKKLSFYEEAPVGKYFRSNDGVIAKNAYELMNLIKIMEGPTYKSHVSDNKNDFALWVEKALGNKELAKKLEKTKSKEETLFLLENASIGSLEDADLDKSFKLKEGIIIKNPASLGEALQNMDREIFIHHVNEEKNDFSLWIKDTFKDDILSEKIRNCLDKKEMIKALEDYFKV